jgi:hypothetical protein
MITVEIKGKSATRFRAYAQKDATRKPTREDLIKAGAKGIALPQGARIKCKVDEVVQEGLVTTGTRVDGDVTRTVVSLSFSETVDRVVFYADRAPLEGELVDDGAQVEHVVGSADVGASGGVEFEFVDAEPKDVVIDASDLE